VLHEITLKTINSPELATKRIVTFKRLSLL
jgi:hypothetical protein